MSVKWRSIIWLLPVLLESVAQYHQTNYIVELKIVEFADYNRSYVRDLVVGLQWYNRTTRIINGNGTLIKNFGTNLKLNIQMYKLVNNAYLFFPITFTMLLCDEVPKNMFGVKDLLLTYSNIPVSCPIPKGFYYMRHGRIDYTQFPPNVPTGDYKFEAKLFHDLDYVAELNAYCSVKNSKKLRK